MNDELTVTAYSKEVTPEDSWLYLTDFLKGKKYLESRLAEAERDRDTALAHVRVMEDMDAKGSAFGRQVLGFMQENANLRAEVEALREQLNKRANFI